MADPGDRTMTVLGCDGSYPGPGGAASGYLVQSGSTSIWVDAGPGTFARLQQIADPGTVDAVILSHEHPDHWSDVESFAVWLYGAPGSERVPVFAPPGLQARSYFGDHPRLDWRPVAPSDRVRIGELDLRFVATDHPPPTVAMRFDGAGTDDPARALAYSADSGPDWSVEELGSGLGTVLCEATYTKDREGSHHHLSGRQAGQMAAAAGVAQLIVTHRLPTVSADALAAEADEAFGRPVHQATIGRSFAW